MAKNSQEKQSLVRWPKKVIIACIRAYQLVLSPWMGNHCRFTPSCSHYAIGAYQKFSFLTASWLSCKRVIKCHPWHQGGLDDVPEKNFKTDTKL